VILFILCSKIEVFFLFRQAITSVLRKTETKRKKKRLRRAPVAINPILVTYLDSLVVFPLLAQEKNSQLSALEDNL
jgi:hypothetical protein